MKKNITELRDGSRLIPKDTVYSYDSFGRRILEGDILNRWARHTEYRGLTMGVWKNAAVHGIKEPRGSRGIDSTGMVFKGMQDFLPAFADFSRVSPYDFTHVALTLPLTAGGEVLGLLQTEHSGINFNPFVSASHTDAERHYYGKDHLGSVRTVMNKWGSPLRTFDYDVSGQPMQDRPERFRHGFTGKEYDGWTGLYNYGFRDYAPLLGRFTTVDPIQDGLNWYAYVNSDPVNWLDPWGLEPCKQESGEDKKNGILAILKNKIETKKKETDDWILIQKKLIKENSVQNLTVNVDDILVLIPEDDNFSGDYEDLIIKGRAAYPNVHIDGVYNVTTGELIKIPNGFSLAINYKNNGESSRNKFRKYYFKNSVNPEKKKLKIIAESAIVLRKAKVIKSDDIKNNSSEAHWLERDVVKKALEAAEQAVKR